MWPTDGPTDIPTDTAKCRVACPEGRKNEKKKADQLHGVQSQSGKIKKLTFLNALGQWFPFIFLL